MKPAAGGAARSAAKATRAREVVTRGRRAPPARTSLLLAATRASAAPPGRTARRTEALLACRVQRATPVRRRPPRRQHARRARTLLATRRAVPTARPATSVPPLHLRRFRAQPAPTACRGGQRACLAPREASALARRPLRRRVSQDRRAPVACKPARPAQAGGTHPRPAQLPAPSAQPDPAVGTQRRRRRSARRGPLRTQARFLALRAPPARTATEGLRAAPSVPRATPAPSRRTSRSRARTRPTAPADGLARARSAE